MPLSLDELNPFAREVATVLFRELPQLRAHARVDDCDHAEPGSLLIELPQPCSGDLLSITTENQEVTVIFDRWHEHFGELEEGTAEQTLAAVAWLRAFFADEVRIVVHMDGEQWRGSSCLPASEFLELGNGTDSYARSWSGAKDARVER